ncbi:MAG: hypothetical protein H6567_09080 [Lewinellaceae bacterium]|nr:hypothetical protein [Lewinellaceae bacterium]
MRLNKYASLAGLGTRRQCAQMISKEGIQVNGTLIFEPAFEVSDSDIIKFHDKELKPKVVLHYWLVNKPQKLPLLSQDDLSTATLVKKKSELKLNPLGDMSDGSCGLCVFTNDVHLIQLFTSNRHKAKSQYIVPLLAPISLDTYQLIRDEISKQGNGIVNCFHRLNESEEIEEITFEVIGEGDKVIYDFLLRHGLKFNKVDREWFCGMTKKDLKRGWSRPLSEKERIFLIHFTHTTQ